ncbi:MAG: PQQ-binding-like beta-propeller repeat protein [Phycisphaerae bacterium]|jgi:outer membrane protein assembly factor BamB|nr:PQQ-binding-like beta-propeller repeat protein [Phycisphaerae bacterium]
MNLPMLRCREYAVVVIIVSVCRLCPAAGPNIHGLEVKLSGGMAVHLSAGSDGTVEKNLISGGRWLVLSLTDDDADGIKLRKTLAATGHKEATHVITWMDRKTIPLSDHMANLLIVDLDAMGSKAPTETEIKRVIVPVRGMARIRRGGKWRTITKSMPDAFDQWTHFLYDATGNAVSKDSAVQVPNALRFIAGPRLQDSNGCNAWRAGQGVAIHEWNYTMRSKYAYRYTLEARDAFNGALLWRKLVSSKKRMGGRSFKSKPLVIADDRLVHIDSDGDEWRLVAHDLYTGKELIRYKNSFDIRAGLKHGEPDMPQMTVSKGRVYQGLGLRLRCLDLKTGAKKWEFSHSDGQALVKMAVAEDLGLLFAIEAVTYKKGHGKQSLNLSGGRYPSAKGQALIAVSLKDGKLKWRRPIDQRLVDYSKVEPWATGRRGEKVRRDYLHLLNYSGGRLFTMYACDANHGNPSLIWALDARSGKSLWVRAAGPHSDKQGHGTREMFNLFALEDGTLLGMGHAWCRLDQRTGSLLAFGSLGGNGRCDTHSCTAGLVTAGFGNFFKLRNDPTEVQWTRRDLARGMCGGRSTPAYGMTYHKGSGCGCFEPIRGNMALHRATSPTPVEDSRRLVRGPAFKTDGNPSESGDEQWPDYLGSPDRRLWSRTTGPKNRMRAIWKKSLAKALPASAEYLAADRLNTSLYNGPLTAPVVSHGLVILADRDGRKIIATTASDGDEKWEYSCQGRVITPPTCRSGRVVFGDRNGWVHCLDAVSGKLAWKFLAAPQQRFIVAYGMIESAWPLHGCLPVVDGTIVATAGYHGEADGGVWAWGLSLTDGSVRWKRRLHRPERPWTNGKPKESREGFGVVYQFKDTGHELASTGKRANGGYSVTLVRNIDLPAASGKVVRVARTPLNAATGELALADKTAGEFVPSAPFARYYERFPFLDVEFEDRGGPHGQGGWTVQLGGKPLGDHRSGQMRMARDDRTCLVARPHYHRDKKKFGMIILRATAADQPEGKQRLKWSDIPEFGFYEGLERLDSFIVAGDRAYVAAEAPAAPHPWLKDRKIPRQIKGAPAPGYLSMIDLTTGRELQRIILDSAVINNGLATVGRKLYVVCEDGTLRCFSE